MENTQIVVEERHEHKFREVPWNQKYGPQMTEVTEHHATYRALLVCSCGQISVNAIRHLLHFDH